ncbi:hypothetical protein Trydic_g4429 [Trypoxylus dichotomus]
MCYENKVMSNSALSVVGSPETVRLSVPEPTTTDSSQKVHKSRLYKIRIGYIINIFIILIVGLALAFIEFDVIPSPRIGYYCKDPSLSYPFTGDTISAVTLVAGSFLAPLIVLVLLEFRKDDQKRSLRLIWRWYKEMLVGIIGTLMITEVMKVIVGEHRPHFISTCMPDTEEICQKGEFVKEYSCTNTYYSFYTVGDSSRSFPSGHTSISVFASIFCASLLHYRYKSRKLGEFFKPFFMVVLLSWGPLCGLTRITDRRHHWWDVLAGAIVGIAGAIYTIIALVRRFRLREKDIKSPSTTTLIDNKNRDGGSVII